MANAEQLTYGTRPESGQPGRTILARSVGISNDCVAEIVRLCEGFGSPPQEGGEVISAALLSFPLETKIRALSGRLFAVIRATFSPDPFFHAVVLSEADFTGFGLNPFAVANENIFLDHWSTGASTKPLDLIPSSLAPLVMPLPSERDVDILDEALRLVFARRRLLLPLFQNDSQSDRFMALLIAALPLSIKRDLRFASFTFSEVNNYNLAAVYRTDSHFEGWHRLLMAAVSGPQPQEKERYLETVKAALGSGDLLAVDQTSRKEWLAKPVLEAKSPEPRTANTATVRSQPIPKPAPKPGPDLVWPSSIPASPKAAHGPRRNRGSRPQKRPSGSGGRRRRTLSFRVPRTVFAALLICLVVAVPLAWFVQDSGRGNSGLFRDQEPGGSGASLLGIIDVGDLYNQQRRTCLQSGMVPGQQPAEDISAKARVALRIGAAEELGQQSRTFVEVAGQGLSHSSPPDREADRLRSLAQRGAVLEQEMRRLLLASFSLETGALWKDLGDLDDSRLKARWDSLNRNQPRRLASVAEGLGLRGPMADVSTAGRQVSNLASLVDLMQRKTRSVSWTRATEKAAQALSSRSSSRAVQAYRATAFQLVRLKRAEDAAGFGSLAFANDYGGGDWLPANVREVLPSLRREVRRYSRHLAPPLAAATLDFYDSLLRAGEVSRAGSAEKMVATVSEISANAAFRFDPGNYTDHLDRIRYLCFVTLSGRGIDPDQIPESLFPAQDLQATRAFGALLACGPSEEQWLEVAEVHAQPFFARWAVVQAKVATDRRVQLETAFDRDWQETVSQVSDCRLLASQGRDWSEAYVILQSRLTRIQQTYQSAFGQDRLRGLRKEELFTLQQAMTRPLPLDLTSVTVRLVQETLSEPTDVILTLVTDPAGPAYRTSPIRMGPSTPDGSGWVGTGPLQFDHRVGPGQALQLRVSRAGDGVELLRVDYRWSAQEMLPAVVTRLKEGRSAGTAEDGPSPGAVVFKLGGRFWKALQLPALGSASNS